MAEEEMRKINYQLKEWEVSVEDLLHMLQHNTNKRLPEWVGSVDLRNICSHGMTYGAMESVCFSCKGLLFYDDGSYTCSRSGLDENKCRSDRIYYVKVSKNCWQIPDTIQNISLKQWHRENQNWILELDQGKIDKRNEVIEKIRTHTVMEIQKEIYRDAEVVYSYFLVNIPDFSDGKFFICQVLKAVRSGKSKYQEEEEQYYLNLVESVYTNPMDDFLPMEKEQAITLFKQKFLCNTTITWDEWCSGCITQYSTITQMLPLRIDYGVNLNDLTVQEIDDMLNWRN